MRCLPLKALTKIVARAAESFGSATAKFDASSAQVALAESPWRDLVLALSLANMALLKLWARLYDGSFYRYLRPGPLGHWPFVAAGVCLLAITLVYFTLLQSLRKANGKSRAGLIWFFLVSLVVPANSIRVVVSDQIPPLHNVMRVAVLTHVAPLAFASLLALVAVPSAVLIWRFRDALYCLVLRSTALLFPCALVTACAIANSAAAEFRYNNKALPSRNLSGSAVPRPTAQSCASPVR